MTAKERGVRAVLTIHQSCGDGWGQFSPYTNHLIGGRGRINAGLVSHLQVDHSCNEQDLPNAHELITIIL
jgi:hypothetical protein